MKKIYAFFGFIALFALLGSTKAYSMNFTVDPFEIGPGKVVTVRFMVSNSDPKTDVIELHFNLPEGVHVKGVDPTSTTKQTITDYTSDLEVGTNGSENFDYKKDRKKGEYYTYFIADTGVFLFEGKGNDSEPYCFLAFDVVCDENVTAGSGSIEFTDLEDGTHFENTTQEVTYYQSDDANLFTEVSVTVHDKFPATISASGFCTICPTVGLDVSGVEAYIVTAVEGKTATLTQIKQLSANEGAIIKGDAGTTVEIPLLSTAKTDVSGNMLTGVTEYTPIDNTSGTIFFLSEGKFKKAAASTFLPAGKAYLTASISSAKEFDFIEFDLPGDETSIQGVSENAEQSSVLYNLNGMRVSKAEKGVYIQNGKKYVVK